MQSQITITTKRCFVQFSANLWQYKYNWRSTERNAYQPLWSTTLTLFRVHWKRSINTSEVSEFLDCTSAHDRRILVYCPDLQDIQHEFSTTNRGRRCILSCRFVENEYNSHNVSLFAILLTKIIKFGGYLTKLWQKKQMCSFFETRCSSS